MRDGPAVKGEHGHFAMADDGAHGAERGHHGSRIGERTAGCRARQRRGALHGWRMHGRLRGHAGGRVQGAPVDAARRRIPRQHGDFLEHQAHAPRERLVLAREEMRDAFERLRRIGDDERSRALNVFAHDARAGEKGQDLRPHDGDGIALPACERCTGCMIEALAFDAARAPEARVQLAGEGQGAQVEHPRFGAEEFQRIALIAPVHAEMRRHGVQQVGQRQRACPQRHARRSRHGEPGVLGQPGKEELERKQRLGADSHRHAGRRAQALRDDRQIGGVGKHERGGHVLAQRRGQADRTRQGPGLARHPGQGHVLRGAARVAVGQGCVENPLALQQIAGAAMRRVAHAPGLLRNGAAAQQAAQHEHGRTSHARPPAACGCRLQGCASGTTRSTRLE